MFARSAARLCALGRVLARPRVANTLKGGLFLLALAAGIGLLVVRIQAIKQRATERGAATADTLAEEWPTGRASTTTATDRLGDPLPPGAVARLGTTRLRPGTEVERLAFSPDGKRLLSRTGSNVRVPDRLTLWDAVTGRQLREIGLPNRYPGSFDWLGDGRILGVVDAGNGMHLVCDIGADLAQPPPIARRQQGEVDPTAGGDDQEHDSCQKIAPSGKLVAVGRAGNVYTNPRWIHVRELAVGEHIEDMKTICRLGPHPGNCDDLVFSADSRLLLAMTNPRQGQEKAVLSLWEVASGKKVAEQTIAAAVQKWSSPCKALSPDGRALALGSREGKARLFDLASGREKYVLTVTPAGSEYESGVSALAFVPGGKHLVAGGCDGVLHVYDTTTGREVWARRGHYQVRCVAVSHDGKHIASGGDGNIRIWDTATGADACPLDGHENMVAAAAVSPDGRRVVTSSLDGSVGVWETATGRLLRRIDTGPRSWPRFTFTPDGRKILGKIKDHIQLWDATTGAAVPLPGQLADQPCSCAAFAPDGKTLAMVSQRKALIWEWPTGRLVRRFDIRPEVAASARLAWVSLSFAPNGRKLLMLTVFEQGRGSSPAPPNSAVDVWDVSSGKHLRRLVSLPGHFSVTGFLADGARAVLPAGVVSQAFYGDAKRISGTLVSVDVHTGKDRQVFAAPGGGKQAEYQRVTAVACSADGRVLASAVGQGLVLLYETATGLPRRRLLGHRGAVFALSFTPDGKRLISGGVDDTGLVWDVELTALAEPEDLPPEQLWNDLASLETRTANRALASLAAAPATAVALLKERLHPADGPDTATLDRLIADLDSDDFAVREKASAELDRLGVDAVPGLRRRVDVSESAEVRRRLRRLLDRHDRGEPSPERVRQGRALEVLEHIGTAEARAVLSGLARGAPEAWLTQEVRRCLERLAARGDGS